MKLYFGPNPIQSSHPNVAVMEYQHEGTIPLPLRGLHDSVIVGCRACPLGKATSGLES